MPIIPAGTIGRTIIREISIPPGTPKARAEKMRRKYLDTYRRGFFLEVQKAVGEVPQLQAVRVYNVGPATFPFIIKNSKLQGLKTAGLLPEVMAELAKKLPDFNIREGVQGPLEANPGYATIEFQLPLPV